MVKSKMDQRRTRYANRPTDVPRAEPLWHFVDRASDFTEVLTNNQETNHEWEREWYIDAEAKDSFIPRVQPPVGIEKASIDALRKHEHRLNTNRIFKDDYKHVFQRNQTIVHRGDFGPTGYARKKPNLCIDTLEVGSYWDYGFDERAETEPSSARVYFASNKRESTANWYWTEKLVSEPHKTNPAYGDPKIDYNSEEYVTMYSEYVEPKHTAYSKSEQYEIGQNYLDNHANGRKKDGDLRYELADYYNLSHCSIDKYIKFADNCNIMGAKEGKSGREYARTYKGTHTRLEGNVKATDDKRFDWVIVIKPENIWKAPWA